jgi:hypothetical protein
MLAGLVVQVVALCYLIKYVRATVGIQKAAGAQTQASQDLAQWQRRQWALDSRKQEWSELIGTLTECVQKIELAKAVAPNVFALATPQWVARQEEARRALLEAGGVISDRLFIKDVLEKERVREDWREIEVMSEGPASVSRDHTAGVAGFAGVTDLQQKWVTLHRKLVRAAQADLGVTVGGLDNAHG